MKVLVADRFEASGLEGLAAAGCEVDLDRPGLEDGALAAALAESGADVLVVRSTKVTAAILSAGRRRAGRARRRRGQHDRRRRRGRARRLRRQLPGRNAVAVADSPSG